MRILISTIYTRFPMGMNNESILFLFINCVLWIKSFIYINKKDKKYEKKFLKLYIKMK